MSFRTLVAFTLLGVSIVHIVVCACNPPPIISAAIISCIGKNRYNYNMASIGTTRSSCYKRQLGQEN